MHYVRFLKGPTLCRTATPDPSTSTSINEQVRAKSTIKHPKPLKSPASHHISALITLETDLGDAIFYGDIELVCIVLGAESAGGDAGAAKKRKMDVSKEMVVGRGERVIKQVEVPWAGGMRSLAVKISLSPEAAAASSHEEPGITGLRIRISARISRKEQLREGTLVMPIVIGQTAHVISEKGVTHPGPRQVARQLAIDHGRELIIWEDAGISMARHVWDAGVALVALLQRIVRNDGCVLVEFARLLSAPEPRSKKLQVLELGAGCGLAGVAFMALVANAEVLITDVADAERLVVQNIAANEAAIGSIAAFQVLDWEQALPEEIKTKIYDIVLVADCIYNEDSIPVLVKTLSSLAERSKELLILVATKRRHSSEALFFDLADEAQFKICSRTYILAPAGRSADDLDGAERIDVYEFKHV